MRERPGSDAREWRPVLAALFRRRMGRSRVLMRTIILRFWKDAKKAAIYTIFRGRHRPPVIGRDPFSLPLSVAQGV